jgi:hypothetical protein
MHATVDNPMTQTGFRERLWRAWLLMQAARGQRVTQTQVAEMLTEAGYPMKQPAVSAWFRGDSEPDRREAYVTLAKVLSWGERGERGWIDPAWLMFGDETEAKGPDDMADWTPEPRPTP